VIDSTNSTRLDDLTVVIISCDNERTIGRTLASVHSLAAHLIVVDSGSTDRTKEICAEYGATVVDHAWEGHIRQKQCALELAETEWILSLDSDESVEPDLMQAIRDVVQSDSGSVVGYEVHRRIFMNGQWLMHTWQPEWRLRLVRRDQARWGGYDPHDKLEADGQVRRLAGTLRHDAFEDIAELVGKQVKHALRAAESYHAMRRRASMFGLLVSPPAAIFKQLIIKSAWLDGWLGCVAAVATGIGAAVKHMQLFQLTHRPTEDSADGPPPTVPGE